MRRCAGAPVLYLVRLHLCVLSLCFLVSSAAAYNYSVPYSQDRASCPVTANCTACSNVIYAGSEYWSALRWTGFAVGRHMRVASATLSLAPLVAQTKPAYWYVFAEASDDSPTGLGSCGTAPHERNRTRAWAGVSVASSAQYAYFNAPVNLNDVINEVLWREKWSSGNALSLIFMPGSYRAIYMAEYGNAGVAAWLTVNFSLPWTGANRSVTVCATEDAAQDPSSPDYTQYTSSAVEQIGARALGFLFRNLSIPRDATVTAAHLTVTSAEAPAAALAWTPPLTLSAERSSNSSSLNSGASLNSRPRTTANVSWTIQESWEKDVQYNSPDFAGVIQEVISSGPLWLSGNNGVLVIIDGTSFALQLSAVTFPAILTLSAFDTYTPTPSSSLSHSASASFSTSPTRSGSLSPTPTVTSRTASCTPSWSSTPTTTGSVSWTPSRTRTVTETVTATAIAQKRTGARGERLARAYSAFGALQGTPGLCGTLGRQ